MDTNSSLLASRPKQDVKLWPHVSVSQGTATALHGFILDPVPPHDHQAKLLMKMGHSEGQSTYFSCCCGCQARVSDFMAEDTRGALPTAGPGY